MNLLGRLWPMNERHRWLAVETANQDSLAPTTSSAPTPDNREAAAAVIEMTPCPITHPHHKGLSPDTHRQQAQLVGYATSAAQCAERADALLDLMQAVIQVKCGN